MQIKNPEVYSLIETIGHHYRNNISNRFTRTVLSTMTLDRTTWANVEELTEKAEHYRYQGYHVDELYTFILAIAKFIHQARKQAVPALKYYSPSANERLSQADRVYREMVINNFGSNLNILADSINKLFIRIVELDKEDAGMKPTVFQRFPELKELGRYLVG